MTILAVDDDPDDFEFFSEAVKEIDQSIVVLKATNGQEALAVLESQSSKPDYIFLDINMPLMDGRQCLQKIKSDEELKDIPVIMYSTTSNQAEIRQFKTMGANFLMKPDRFAQLVQSLSFIFGYTSDRSDLLLI